MKWISWKVIKVFINLCFLTTFGIILYQNNYAVELDLLFWEARLPMALIILGMVVMGALMTLIWELIVGDR